jgi:hypothetical protein
MAHREPEADCHEDSNEVSGSIINEAVATRIFASTDRQ